MNWWRGVATIPARQVRVLVNAMTGRPLSMPPLGSVTLDDDDVTVTRNLLAQRRDWFTLDDVEAYESEFAEWNGSRHAVALMSGRVALSACIDALGLGPGDEVIVPGYTCVVVPNAFEYAGVRVVYADIELETYGLSADSVRDRLTRSTRAVMVQHLYGLVSRDYEAVLELAERHGLLVIEDCCHATGASLNARRVGNRGHAAFYSSEQSKVFTTIQGGVAVTNDDDVAVRLRGYRDQAPFPTAARVERQLENVLLNFDRFKHPQRWWRGDLAYLRRGRLELVSTTEDECAGDRPGDYGMRMPGAIARLARNQLRKVDGYNERRRHAARSWDVWCRERDWTPPRVLEGSTPVFLRYPLLVDPAMKRDTRWALKDPGVDLGVWFSSHLHPSHRRVRDCPNADEAVARCVNLPTILM